jgi:hypothetical protein
MNWALSGFSLKFQISFRRTQLPTTRRGSEVGERKVEQEGIVGLLQKEVAELQKSAAQRQEGESHAQLAQEVQLLRAEQARSGEAMRRAWTSEAARGRREGLARSEERVREALTWQIGEETVGLRGSKNGIGQRTVQL